MSEFGFKIKNYEAAVLYEYKYGFRGYLESTDAMLTNSLFLDFLLENGLETWKDEATRDIICLQFNYGTKSYEEMIGNLSNKAGEYFNNIKECVEKNKKYAVKIKKEELRTMYYEDGVTIDYGKDDVRHYRMLYRTPGKAKKGTCMFIVDRLYDKAREFLYMGFQLPQENSPIVEIGAYSSLITSTIVDRIQIKPEEILVVRDYDSFFTTNVTTVNVDENKECYAEEVDNYTLKNTIFDGQALIDSSIFPNWANGYILLRHHMTKCAAFNTNIQLFMREHFGEDYNNAILEDMWGRKVRVKNIKLITTDNAIKWLKFGIPFEHWAEWLRKNNSMWGIVKTAHQSKLGDVQRMSYQMVNSLNIDSMPEVVNTSLQYINKLKQDDDFFLEYLRENINFSNDYEVLVALVEHNPEFLRSEYFRERKKTIIKNYILNFKSGRVIQNADNLTIVGSPYAMLLHSVGISPEEDSTFEVEDDAIQVWTARFNDGEYLAEFRSPFNSRNNLGYVHNVYHEYFDKYFNFGELIIAVNMIGTFFQDRNNGSDQDSDSVYVTNQYDIVQHAKYCYSHYPTIVNLIPKQKNEYSLSLKNYAKIDNKLAEAQLAIGQSSNLAQLCLTYSYNFDDKKYKDYVCILSVLAQCAIDNTKRTFDVDLKQEIDRIGKDMGVEENGLPLFWQITKKDKRKARNDEERIKRDRENRKKIQEKVNSDLICPMNYLYNLNLDKFRSKDATLPMSEFFIKHEPELHHRKCRKVEELIEKYSFDLYSVRSAGSFNEWKENEFCLLLLNDYNNLIKDIRSVYISNNYKGLMSWLINRAFMIGSGVRGKNGQVSSQLKKNRAVFLSVLYNINKNAFLSCFKVANNCFGDASEANKH